MPRPHDEVSSPFVQRPSKTRLFYCSQPHRYSTDPLVDSAEWRFALPVQFIMSEKRVSRCINPLWVHCVSFRNREGRLANGIVERAALFSWDPCFESLNPLSPEGSRQMSYPRAKRCGAFSTGCVASPWNYQTVLRRWFKSTARQKVSADQRWLPRPDSIRLTSDSWSAGSEARIWTRLRPSHTVWDSRFRS